MGNSKQERISILLLMSAKTTILALLWAILQLVSYITTVIADTSYFLSRKLLSVSKKLRLSLEDDFDKLQDVVDEVKNWNN